MRLTENIEFFNLLSKNNEFCSELGKVTLASGKLESHIKGLLKNNGYNNNLERATLGKLISIAEREQHIDENTIKVLKDVKRQRNFLTHNIHSLMIGEATLEDENMWEKDIHLFIDRAWQLQENLNSLADIF